MNSKLKSKRVGETNINYQGSIMKIIKYVDSRNIVLEFQDKYKVKKHTTYAEFKKGRIKNPYSPSVFNIGFIGEGKHRISTKGRITKKYITWTGILKRCYDKKCKEKQPTYKNVTMCKDWHNFQIFGDWFDENYYEVDGERMALDKDILFKNNKIYSPKTCVFVTKNINSLFTRNKSNRGKYPIGVYYRKQCNHYRAKCQNQLTKTQNNLGHFSTAKKAFDVYKEYKEGHIKEVADYYKSQIPKNLYDALYNYEVEITD